MNCTPQFDRQGGQRAYAVCEMGATANRRDDLGVKDRGAWWGGLKRPVRMPAAAKGHNVFFGFSSDFKNVSVPTHSGYERIVAVRPEGFSEAFQLVVGESLIRKIKNLIAQPQSSDSLSVGLAKGCP